MGSRVKSMRSLCARHGRTRRYFNNININIDFFDSTCYKMNSSSLVEETLDFERGVAHDRLRPGQRYKW
jgi:hypothetical protein